MLFDALCCFVESVECYSKTWRFDRLPGRGSCNLLEIVNILNFRVEVSSVFIETVLFFQNLSQTQECHLAFPLFSHLFNFVQRSLVQCLTMCATQAERVIQLTYNSRHAVMIHPLALILVTSLELQKSETISQSQLCQVLCWKWFSMMKLDLEIFDCKISKWQILMFGFKLILHCQSFGFGSHLP